MRLNDGYKKIQVYQPGKSVEDVKKEYGLKEVVKLASNENPFGTSKRVRERVLKELDKVSSYPDGAGRNLREKIASFYDVAENKIIFGNGSDELVQYLSRAYLSPATEVIMATPTFPMYRANALMEGATIVEIPLIDGVHDLRGMVNAVNDNTVMIWICNPNNPTGTIITEAELISFLDKIPKEILVIIDEAYQEYVMAEDFPNVFKLMKNYPNIMVLRTFSKIYGLAGLRIGYGIANEEVIADLLKVKEPFNANHLALVSAEEALIDQEYITYCKEQNNITKEFFIEGLNELNIQYFPSEANFVLVKHNLEDSLVFDRFIREGLIVRAGDKLGIFGSFRVTMGTIDQMKRVLEVLKAII